MKFDSQRNIWLTLMTLLIGAFTSFNGYEVNQDSKATVQLQNQMVLMERAVSQLNNRIDNLYEQLFDIKGDI